MPSWYSPFVSLSDITANYLKGKQDPKKMKAFVTQDKAELWKEVLEQKDETKILELKISLPRGIVPKDELAPSMGTAFNHSIFGPVLIDFPLKYFSFKMSCVYCLFSANLL